MSSVLHPDPIDPCCVAAFVHRDGQRSIPLIHIRCQVGFNTHEHHVVEPPVLVAVVLPPNPRILTRTRVSLQRYQIRSHFCCRGQWLLNSRLSGNNSVVHSGRRAVVHWEFLCWRMVDITIHRIEPPRVVCVGIYLIPWDSSRAGPRHDSPFAGGQLGLTRDAQWGVLQRLGVGGDELRLVEWDLLLGGPVEGARVRRRGLGRRVARAHRQRNGTCKVLCTFETQGATKVLIVSGQFSVQVRKGPKSAEGQNLVLKHFNRS